MKEIISHNLLTILKTTLIRLQLDESLDLNLLDFVEQPIYLKTHLQACSMLFDAQSLLQ